MDRGVSSGFIASEVPEEFVLLCVWSISKLSLSRCGHSLGRAGLPHKLTRHQRRGEGGGGGIVGCARAVIRRFKTTSNVFWSIRGDYDAWGGILIVSTAAVAHYQFFIYLFIYSESHPSLPFQPKYFSSIKNVFGSFKFIKN